jgi:hypothetical protein
MTVPVYDTAGAYRAAVAELPRTAHHAGDPRGAVVVVAGNGSWADAVRAAAASGASCVIVAEPEALHPGDVRSLAEEISIPVVVERIGLREDDVRSVRDVMVDVDGLVRPRVVTVECEAPAESLDRIVADAVGWLRVCAGTSVEPRRGWASDTAGVALLEFGEPGTVVTLTWTTGGPSGVGWIRMQTLGERRIEVVIDGARAVVAYETAAGRTVLPPALESSSRLVLRRAAHAVSRGEAHHELSELAEDTELALRLMAPRL